MSKLVLPGAWEYGGRNDLNQGYDVDIVGGGTIATAYEDEDGDEVSRAYAEEAAKIIAAAPDLLDVCEWVAELTDGTFHDGDILKNLHEIGIKARAAIAKAEGKPIAPACPCGDPACPSPGDCDAMCRDDG